MNANRKSKSTSTPLKRAAAILKKATSAVTTRSQKLLAEDTLLADFSISESDVSSIQGNTTVVQFNMAPGSSKGDNGNADEYVDGKTPYTVVISWFRKYNGSREKYSQFVFDCERAFRKIEPKSYECLMDYVISMLDNAEFPEVHGTFYTKWESLKLVLDEHFHIRLTEKSLFRELTDMERLPGEEIFKFYNRLVAKCCEYKQFLKTASKEKNFVESRVKQAEDYILESFIFVVDKNIRPVLISMQPKTIQEAFLKLRELEMSMGNKDTEPDEVNAKLNEVLNLMKSNSINEKPSNNFANPSVNRMETNNKEVCQLCNKDNHVASNCWSLKYKAKEMEEGQQQGYKGNKNNNAKNGGQGYSGNHWNNNKNRRGNFNNNMNGYNGYGNNHNNNYGNRYGNNQGGYNRQFNNSNNYTI